MDWGPTEAARGILISYFFWWLVGRAAVGFQGWAGSALVSPPLAYLGRISFGVYVLHVIIPVVIVKCQIFLGVWLHYPGKPGLPQLIYVTILSVALASLSWHLMEKPLLGLKRFFPYARPDSKKAQLLAV